MKRGMDFNFDEYEDDLTSLLKILGFFYYHGFAVLNGIIVILTIYVVVWFYNNPNVPPTYSHQTTEAPQMQWSQSELATSIPTFSTTDGKIMLDKTDKYWVTINNVSETDHADYLTSCKNKGFTIDATSNSILYSAYDSTGRYLAITYDDSSYEMFIRLDAAIKMTDIIWSNTDVAQKVPVPNSKRGKIIIDSATCFNVYVDNVNFTQYKNYIDTCDNAGFTNNCGSTEKMFCARTKDNKYELTVEYYGINMIHICISVLNA